METKSIKMALKIGKKDGLKISDLLQLQKLFWDEHNVQKTVHQLCNNFQK